MKETESASTKAFKDFISELQITPYGEYYVQKVFFFLNKCTIQRKINLNSFFAADSQEYDRKKLIEAVRYIDVSGMMEWEHKRIVFEEKIYEKFIFYIDRIVKLKK